MQSLMQMIALYNQQLAVAQFGVSQAPVAASAINVSHPPPPSTIVPQSTVTPSLSTPSHRSATTFWQDYEVLIHIEAKPKPGSCKNAKSEIKVFESHQLSSWLGWDDFLSQLAAILNVTKAALKVPRMRYHWSKPNSLTDVPLISEDGYVSMIKNLLQLGKKVSEGGFRVIITMDPPDIIGMPFQFQCFFYRLPEICHRWNPMLRRRRTVLIKYQVYVQFLVTDNNVD